MFVPKFADRCVAMSCRLGIVILALDSLDLLEISFWLILDGSWTATYAAAQYFAILGLQNVYICDCDWL